MTRITIVVSAIVCAFLVGCGAHAPVRTQVASAPDVDRPTEAERYTAAIDEAFVAYEAEIALAHSIEYDSRDEAETVARTLASNRFEYLLVAALHARGLSLYGLGEFGRMHPEFVETQEARNQQRFWRLRAAALSIAETHTGPSMVVVIPRETDDRLASAR